MLSEIKAVCVFQFSRYGAEDNIFPNDPDGKEAKRFSDLCKALTLSICYAANIGGICTLTGTGPNLIVKGQLDV